MRITYGRVGFELNANLLDSHSMRYSIRIRVDRPLDLWNKLSNL